MQLANAVGDVMNAGDAAYWREKQATGEFSTGRRRLGGGEMDDAQNGETDDQNGRRRLGAETSLRLDMLQHILSVSTTTLLTPEIGQAQAHAMAKMTGVASELSADSLFTAFGIINSVAHTATAASPTDAVAAAAAMHAGVSNVLDASNLDAAFNGLPAGTPSGEIFDQARKALDQIATGLLQALSCGESAAELVSARMSTLVTRECNIFDSVMAGQDYQIPGRGVQTVDIRTPVFVSPPSKGSSVGVAMTLFHVNPAVLASPYTVGSSLVQGAAYVDGALGAAPALKAGECFGMVVPTEMAPERHPVCAAWVADTWDRLSCNTLGVVQQGGQNVWDEAAGAVVQTAAYNATRCCCSTVGYFGVLLLPRCPYETYPSDDPTCLSIPAPPIPCLNNCTGNGRCLAHNGTCSCYPTFFGADCGNQTAPVGTQCPGGGCSGHGMCIETRSA
jgi:hypothetical protein